MSMLQENSTLTVHPVWVVELKLYRDCGMGGVPNGGSTYIYNVESVAQKKRLSPERTALSSA